MSGCERCEEYRRALANPETRKSPTLVGLLVQGQQAHGRLEHDGARSSEPARSDS